MKALRLSSITTPGRREREKAATRAALSEAALKLFLERGYGKVTVAEIAEAADTAVATLFAHFPAGKEALILDDSGEREAALTAALASARKAAPSWTRCKSRTGPRRPRRAALGSAAVRPARRASPRKAAGAHDRSGERRGTVVEEPRADRCRPGLTAARCPVRPSRA
ncbi:hypothetical protein GCM10022267_62350 [Lentzea roselyniae]|uniref:HTH tetR-type domain-containing protein n=1 Tax=Lentzea roselyniae TaxID=531940 RepID=A0ABP7BSF5_9PSEU